MADQFVQVVPDSTGKKIQVFENIVGASTVEAQAIVPVSSAGVPFTTANPLPAGVVIGALAGATRISSTVFEGSKVLKAGAGTLVSLTGSTTAVTDQYIQLFNSTTVPANGTAPITYFTLPAGSDFSYDLPITGMPFTVGITVSNSTTTSTKTAGAADCWFCAVIAP